MSRWQAFKHSPYYAAVVISLLAAVGAAVFAGAYTYALANPTPHRMPVAVAGEPESARTTAYVSALEEALHTTLRIHTYPDYPQAVDAVERQRVFAIVRERDDAIDLSVSSASGASVAELLKTAGPAAGHKIGAQVTVTDLKPLHSGDPRGLALFYITLAAVIIGFLGTIQLSVHASRLTPGERIVAVAGFSALGGFLIAATVDWILDAVPLPLISWLQLMLTMFTAGMVFTVFNTFFGRWALLPTWALLVILGNPASGGPVSWPLLPAALGILGRWLPPGASVNALHNAVYFHGYQHLQPYLVLLGWALVSSVIFWTWRTRHPGGREKHESPAL
ncbi:ABC transporter permease [Streptomyces xiamenensis]|uniref:Integral membrane protein n=1 Tax=Streptomyces xiamenensis TaxID=408015 RepID=A0A0F7CPA8_9ACTN|nr:MULTISPECIES: membrane protein [Streptomyces]AKG44336.1 integral membrane protein [Streptomyces xiamenensis]